MDDSQLETMCYGSAAAEVGGAEAAAAAAAVPVAVVAFGFVVSERNTSGILRFLYRAVTSKRKFHANWILYDSFYHQTENALPVFPHS